MFSCIAYHLYKAFKAYTMVAGQIAVFKSGRGTRESIKKVQAATIKKKQVDVLPSKNQAMCKLNHC